MLFRVSTFVAAIFIAFSCAESDFPAKYTLNTGYEFPSIGCKLYYAELVVKAVNLSYFFELVGTYLILGKELTNRVIDEALASGYRLFDSAHLYNNEKDLGKAFKEILPKHNLTRNDIFITTKICKLSSQLFS
jgi:diketogulonate reductase-like aldo/keto reductase